MELFMQSLEVPVIALGRWFAGSPDDRAALAHSLDRACREIGFLVITEHGVDAALVARLDRVARAFFAQPLASKRALDRPRDDAVRGYSALGEEGLSYSLEQAAPGDLKESFSIGPLDVPDDDYHRGPSAGAHFEPNIWPQGIADFEPACRAYFEAMSVLARELMRIFALALALPTDYFDTRIDRHISMLRVLSYPPQLNCPEEGQMRAGAHSDYGSLTIVSPDGPGLQVCNQAGQWVDVPMVEGGLVVNIGDLMQQWTHDRWRSTLHRVCNPPWDGCTNHTRRQSLVFFHQPNYDAQIECLPTCLPADGVARYPPISSGAHLQSKFLKQTTFGGSKARL
jgi:isopenicillin N synthase-like dioxygenase